MISSRIVVARLKRLRDEILALTKGEETLMYTMYTLKLDCQNCGKAFDVQIPFGCDAPEMESIGVGQREIWSVSYVDPDDHTVCLICPACGSDNVKKDRRGWPWS